MWQVYEFEDATNVFRHHQHSVGVMAVIGDTCKLGQQSLPLQEVDCLAGQALQSTSQATITLGHSSYAICKRKLNIAAVVALTELMVAC